MDKSVSELSFRHFKSTKEELASLPLTLVNIKENLEILFSKTTPFDKLNDKTVILAIGATGSGKSTLFNSLLYG